MSAIVAVGSAFKGAFGGPELWEADEERWVFVGGLRVAILVIFVLEEVCFGRSMIALSSCFGANSRRFLGCVT